MRIGCFYAVLAICFFQTLKANNDTLRIAKEYIQQRKYNKAEKMLRAFEQNHPNDLNVLWLYGQTAYWNGHMKTFNKVYNKAIMRFPSNYYLKLDYAIKLGEIGNINKAASLLAEYFKYDKTGADVKLLSAKLAYWHNDYQSALHHLDAESVKEQKPQEAQQLREEILTAQSFWIKAGADYLADDQPLQQLIPHLEAGKSFNEFFSPSISIQNPFFKTNTTSVQGIKLDMGNKFNLNKIRLRIAVNAGFVRLPNKTNEVCGGVELVKTSFNYLQLTAIAARQPYLSTISSVYNTVIPFHYELNVALNNQNFWNGKMVSSFDQFNNDKNYVYNVGFWFFSPPLKLNPLQLRIGYSYGYASSKENRYTSKEPLAAIVATYSSGKAIEGVYQPYFTPFNQQTHSALLNLSFKPTKKLEVGANASIAFAGNLDNPYLFLDKNSTNELFINKGYSNINFYPNKIETFLLCKFTKKMSVKANYTFFKNAFYTSQLIGASVILNFWNE